MILRLLICFNICNGVYIDDTDPIYDEYLSLSEIETEFEKLKDETSNPAASNYTYGVKRSKYLTADGNSLTFVSVSDQASEIHDWVIIVCGLDGSDWTAVTACLNILKNPRYYGFPIKNDELSNSNVFLSAVNLLVIPIANPDGYQYTFTDDRLWKKNRASTNGLCKGVNLENNFNYRWCEDDTCTTNPCSADYAGSSTDSEIEIISITEELSNRGKYKNIRAWLTVNQHESQTDAEIDHGVLFSTRLDSINRQSTDRHEIFITEKIANAMTRLSIKNIAFKVTLRNNF